MLKTNCKIVRERIRAFILSAENVEEFAPEGTPNETYNDKARAIYADFMRFYDGDNRNKYRPRNYQEAFEEWAAGLPAILDTCYYYNISAIDLLGDILEETAEERAKYDESAAELAKLYAELEKIKYCADSEVEKMYKQREALTKGDIIAYFEECMKEDKQP